MHKNKSPATSLAAGNDTVAMVLLEAMTLLALGGDEVIAIVADEPLPGSLCPGHETTPVAAALVLGQDTGGGTGVAPPLAILEDLRQVRAAAASADRPLEVDSPCAAILPLISTLSTLGLGRSGRVAVSPSEDLRWSIEVRTA